MLVTNYAFVLSNQCVYIHVSSLACSCVVQPNLELYTSKFSYCFPIGVHSYHLNKKINIIVHLMCSTPSNVFFFFSLETNLNMPLMHHNFISVQARTKLNPKLNLSRLVTLAMPTQ